MVTVFYPYYRQQAAWQELRYSLRSLEKHFKEDFEVWIIGDKPEWITNVHHIQFERNEFQKEPCLFDTNSKLLKLISINDVSDNILRMNDDVYLLRDVDLKDFRKIRALYKYTEITNLFQSYVWKQQMLRTAQVLIKDGLEGWMTETHCPELFDKERMLNVFNRYNPIENSLLPSSLYYNTYPDHGKILIEKKNERAAFYGKEDEYSYSSDAIGEKCNGKVFLNHNNIGLNSTLKNFIIHCYDSKSRFEK